MVVNILSSLLISFNINNIETGFYKLVFKSRLPAAKMFS